MAESKLVPCLVELEGRKDRKRTKLPPVPTLQQLNDQFPQVVLLKRVLACVVCACVSVS